jgi:hypothetical protein
LPGSPAPGEAAGPHGGAGSAPRARRRSSRRRGGRRPAQPGRPSCGSPAPRARTLAPAPPIWRRTSSGHVGCVVAIVNTSFHSGSVSTKPGQVHPMVEFRRHDTVALLPALALVDVEGGEEEPVVRSSSGGGKRSTGGASAALARAHRARSRRPSRPARCAPTSSARGSGCTTIRTARSRSSTDHAASPATTPRGGRSIMLTFWPPDAAGRPALMDLWTSLRPPPRAPRGATTTAVKPCATKTGQLNLLSTAIVPRHTGEDERSRPALGKAQFVARVVVGSRFPDEATWLPGNGHEPEAILSRVDLVHANQISVQPIPQLRRSPLEQSRYVLRAKRLLTEPPSLPRRTKLLRRSRSHSSPGRTPD